MMLAFLALKGLVSKATTWEPSSMATPRVSPPGALFAIGYGIFEVVLCDISLPF